MIRWLSFCFGIVLLITTLFLRDYRANHEPDSTSLIVMQQSDIGSQLVAVNLLRREENLLETANYVSWYGWSGDGKWLLITTPEEWQGKLLLLNAKTRTQQTLGNNIYFIAHPTWSPTRPEFAYMDQYNGAVRIRHGDTTGEILDEYVIDMGYEGNWRIEWVTETIIHIINDDNGGGYRIDFATDEIQSSSFPINDAINPSPDGHYKILTGTTELRLVSAETGETVWELEADNLAWLKAGWSADSQGVALLAQSTIPQYPPYHDVYSVSIEGNDLRRLVHDKRNKIFLPNYPAFDKALNPLSHNRQWLVFAVSEDNYTHRTLNVVSTNGSHAEITNLLTSERGFIAAQWMPPSPDLPIHTKLFIPCGLGLLVGGLGLSVWHWRRQNA